MPIGTFLTINYILFGWSWFFTLGNTAVGSTSRVWTAGSKITFSQIISLSKVGDARIFYPEELFSRFFSAERWTGRLTWSWPFLFKLDSSESYEVLKIYKSFKTTMLMTVYIAWIMHKMTYSSMLMGILDVFDILLTALVSTDFLFFVIRNEPLTCFQKSVIFVCNGRATYFAGFRSFWMGCLSLQLLALSIWKPGSDSMLFIDPWSRIRDSNVCVSRSLVPYQHPIDASTLTGYPYKTTTWPWFIHYLWTRLPLYKQI